MDDRKEVNLDEYRAGREERDRRLEDNAAAFLAAIVPDKVDQPKPQGDGPPKDVTRVPPDRRPRPAAKAKKRGKKAPAHAPYLPRNMARNIRDGRRGHIEAVR